MSRRFYIETSPSGHHQFVTLKRSRSHHHHHGHGHGHDHDHHHHHHHHKCPVSKEEWEKLLERERGLREANDNLCRENYTLKCDLQNAEVEIRRYQGWVPNLQNQIQALTADNAALRRSLDSAGEHAEKQHREVERLNHKLHKAEREIECLRARIQELAGRARHCVSDRIEELTCIIKDWKRKFEVVDEHNCRLRRDLDKQTCLIAEQRDRIRTYESILRRHGIFHAC